MSAIPSTFLLPRLDSTPLFAAYFQYKSHAVKKNFMLSGSELTLQYAHEPYEVYKPEASCAAHVLEAKLITCCAFPAGSCAALLLDFLVTVSVV